MRTVLAIEFSMLAGLFMFLAGEWQYEGMGLHPAIAMPLAFIAVAMGFSFNDWMKQCEQSI